MNRKLVPYILCLAAAATALGQRSFTATPIYGPSSLALWNLTWISDDGKNGLGTGIADPQLSVAHQCFTYHDGVSAILPTPGLSCHWLPSTQGAFEAGISIMTLAPIGQLPSSYNLVLNRPGSFTPIPLPNTGVVSAGNVNRKGEIALTSVCTATASNRTVPCANILTTDGKLTRLPDLGSDSAAVAINDRGDVTGYVVEPGKGNITGRHPVLWPHTGGMVDLSALTPSQLGTPSAINGLGQVAGSSAVVGFEFTGPGFFFDGAGNILPIPLRDAASINISSLNDRGEIVGSYRPIAGTGLSYPLYYANGTAQDMNGSISNLPSDMYISGASYISNTGLIVATAVFARQPIGAGGNGSAPLQYLLTPSNTSALPMIVAVNNAASHLPGVAESTWIEIRGQNLSATTRTWTSSDFDGNHLPTSLDGVSVTINGTPAYVSYVSPVQVNVLAPDDPATGTVHVQVTNGLGTSLPFSVAKLAVSPALFNTQGEATTESTPGQVVATHADGSQVFTPGFFGCIGDCSPARPGETITLYGTGFGATKSPAPAGEMIGAPTEIANTVTATIGGIPATVAYAGRTASGLDQINVVIPVGVRHDVPDGVQVPPVVSVPIVVTVNGIQTPDYLRFAMGVEQ